MESTLRKQQLLKYLSCLCTTEKTIRILSYFPSSFSLGSSVCSYHIALHVIYIFSKHNKGKHYGLGLLFEEELNKHTENWNIFQTLAKEEEYAGEKEGSKYQQGHIVKKDIGMKEEVFSQTAQKISFFTINRNFPLALLKKLLQLPQFWDSAGCDPWVPFLVSRKAWTGILQFLQ